jgi:alkanesulfonate monooxygenase SsuD/methylene tetrahydromethanopterin reductase-like flavin-dependent oxidoreductase (luciferase family)
MLAKSVATVDHGSGGRVELGMGAGWFEREHAAYGFPFPPVGERMEILAEQVEIVHRLWDRDEDEVTFEGTHYRLESCPSLPKPAQEPHPPLIIGGGAGPRSAALAARWGDEYDVFSVDPETARERHDRVSTACEKIDRDSTEVRFSLMTTTLVGADQRELERHARALMDRSGETGDVGAYLEGMRSNRLVGTVDAVLERLDEYASTAGVDRVYLQHLAHREIHHCRDVSLGIERRTAEPPQNATHRNPSSSTVIPSGSPHSFGISTNGRR